MKKNIITVLVSVFSSLVLAQVNLVPNPSFEDTIRCPISLGDDGCVVSWTSYANTPDYFNTCHNASGSAGVPSNYYGFQQPHSGNGYYGMIVYSTNGSYREPIGCSLTTPLIVNQRYYASACVCLSNCSPQAGNAANNLGFVFTNVGYNISTPIPINNFSHVFTNAIIIDTLNWVRIIGSFVANSAYTKVAFGNFYSDQNTTSSDPLGCANGVSYYYIDDICVSTDSIYAANYITSIEDVFNKDQIEIYPNPASNLININTSVKNIPTVFDARGNKIDFVYERSSTGNIINVSEWNNGIYFLRLNNSIRKIAIHH